MNGEIGRFFNPKALQSDIDAVKGIFREDFHTAGQWTAYFSQNLFGGVVDSLLAQSAGSWTAKNFQALYVACWIFHPVEKGSFMLRLDGSDIHGRIKSAFEGLVSQKKLQTRSTSHLSKTGVSAHVGWAFLRGYDELLLQLEGTPTAPYLFLKCEGHPLDGALSTLKHVASYIHKRRTGAGKTASQALQDFSEAHSTIVEARAAENYGKAYEKLLEQLGLKGKMVTVAQMLEGLLARCTSPKEEVPDQIRGNSLALGKAMLGPDGYIEKFKTAAGTLKKAKVDFSEDIVGELTDIGNRLMSTSDSHPVQYYNEIRVSSADLSGAIKAFTDLATK